MPALTHPPADTLAAFGRGALPPDKLAGIADHVAGCAACCAALRDFRDDSFVHLLREAGTPDGGDGRTAASLPDTPPPLLAPPDARTALADHPQYRLLDQLGEGGMGVVFKAEHKVMGRVVALKVMAPHLTARPAAVARFRQEVKAAARLNHPNIVTAHDAGEAGGLHFLVMEFVEGVSLDRLVARRGPLAVALACQFVRQAAQGLQHAFEKGMVHRDIKPQNLMVTRKGQIKVLDFGLARFARDPEPGPVGGGGPAPSAAAATAANFIMGTPDYLSPEQAKCAGVDIRADVYSLGCTLYFLLAGRAPFEAAGSVFEKLLAHTTEEPPPLALTRLDVPAGLLVVLARMTAKNPVARYATPAEAAAALAPFARGDALGAVPATEAVGPVPIVEAVVVPAPSTASPWAAATDPGPTQVVTAPARPARERRKKKPARRGWGPGRWAAVGAAVVALVVGGVAARQALKRPAAPTTAAVTPPPTPEPPPRPTRLGGAKPADPAPAPARGGAGLKVVFVLPVKGLLLADYVPVRDRLEQAGVTVKVAVGPPPPFAPKGFGFEPGYSYPAKEPGNEGPPVAADLDFGPNLDLTGVGAVVFVGKDVSEFTFKKGARATEDVIRRAQDQKVVLGGICVGQAVLAYHGALDGKKVAASPHVRHVPQFQGTNVRWEDVRVRTDGRVVTAAEASDAVPFADALIAAMRE